MNSQFAFLLGIVLLIGLDLLIIAARSGLRQTNLARLLKMRDEIDLNIDLSLNLTSSMPRPYVGLSFWQALLRFLLAGLFLLALLWENTSIGLGAAIGYLVLAGLFLALIEWIIERYISHSPEIWVIRLGPLIQTLSGLLFPLIALSMWLSKESSTDNSVSSTLTEDELKILVDTGQQEGILEQEERQMIFSVFQLGDTLTREIMVPRIEMLSLDIKTPLPDALDALLESGYSRLPVFRERVDNVIGMLYAKDLLKVWREGNGKGDSIQSLLRTPYFVPEAKKVDELLTEMQSRHVHMAVVVDEYGGVAGVVTMEDIVEEIFGEIQDEYDEEDLPYQIVENGDYIFRGRIDLDDFNDILSTKLPREEADTLSGFIYGRLGHVPVQGESVMVDGLNLVVEKVSNRRIRKVRAQKLLLDGDNVDQ